MLWLLFLLLFLLLFSLMLMLLLMLKMLLLFVDFVAILVVPGSREMLQMFFSRQIFDTGIRFHLLAERKKILYLAPLAKFSIFSHEAEGDEQIENLF